MILIGSDLAYLKPYWRVILTDCWLPIGAYGGRALVTITSMLYAAARALGLVDLGWKVDLVDRSIRCGEGDPELADALQREAEDKFR